jgi:hypothetical protein
MAAKEISVKKYVVRLNGEEREQLEALIRKGKSAAQRLLKARILFLLPVERERSEPRAIELGRRRFRGAGFLPSKIRSKSVGGSDCADLM